MSSIGPFILIGCVFSPLAALAAFLITYEEWSHHYTSGKEPLRHAIEAAVVAFLIFMVLTVLAGVVVSRFM